MKVAFEKVAVSLGMHQGVITIGANKRPVTLHCAPDSLSIPESRKFIAYAFDGEIEQRSLGDAGKLHVVASFGSATDSQIRRHMGSFEAVEVYKGAWGFYAAESSAGLQCVYLPHCTNSLVMESRLTQAIDWLQTRAAQTAQLSDRRKQILDVVGYSRAMPVRKRARGTRGPLRGF